MPNPVKYSTVTPSGSLRKGNMAIGVNPNVALGPTSVTGFYAGINPPSGGYTIYQNKVSQGPSIYVANNSSDLIRLTKEISGTTYANVAGCLNYFASQTDKIIIASSDNIPAITTSGSILNLNADVVSSYPTTASTWYDVSGNNSNSTLLNGTLYNTNNYMVFDGVDDYVSLPSSINWALSASSTVSVLCNPTGGSGWIVAFDKGSWNGWFINVNAFLYNGQAGSDQTLGLNGVYNAWQLFTVVVDRENLLFKTYKNGAFIAQTAITQPPIGNANNLYLGSRGGVPDNFYNGKIASVQLYNKILSQAEILQNYYQAPIVTDGLVFAVDAGNLVSYENGSTTMYSLTGSNDAKFYNGPIYVSEYGGGIYRDSADDFITGSITVPSTTTNYSVETWFKANPGNGYRALISAWNASQGGAGNWEFQFNGPNQLGVHPTYTVSYTPNTIVHAVYTQNGTETKIYINGVLQQTSTTSGADLRNGKIGIGNLSGAGYPSYNLDSTIYLVRIYNTTLSSTEIQQNFKAQKNRFGL